MRIIAAVATILCLLPDNIPAQEPIRGLYVGRNAIDVRERAENAAFLIRNYEPNTVVVDKKDDRGIELTGEEFRIKTALFRLSGAYIICRIVTFKDTTHAARKPELYVRSRKNPTLLWRTDRKEIEHFLDPALEGTFAYIRDVTVRAINDGCDELNYDYIRFPSDGNMKDTLYPSGEEAPQRKREVMNRFLERLAAIIKTRSPERAYSADLFGYAAMGRNPGIGQFPEDFERHGFRTYGMFYPSHYSCNEFGVPDPNTNPYVVVVESLTAQIRYLLRNKIAPNGWVTAWIQGFDYPNIYGCGLDENGKGIKGEKGIRTAYANDTKNFRDQIRALRVAISSPEFKDMRLKESWIVWHPSADYRKENFEHKSKER